LTIKFTHEQKLANKRLALAQLLPRFSSYVFGITKNTLEDFSHYSIVKDLGSPPHNVETVERLKETPKIQYSTQFISTCAETSF